MEVGWDQGWKIASVWMQVAVALVLQFGVLTAELGRWPTQEEVLERSMGVILGEQVEAGQVRVVRVVDGDTLEIEGGERVRLIGIDAPETKDPRVGVECFGREAALSLELKLEGQTVRLEKDVSETDRYGRLLRYVWIEERFINEEQVQEGVAVASAYPPDVAYQARLEAAETAAREAEAGLWGGCE